MDSSRASEEREHHWGPTYRQTQSLLGILAAFLLDVRVLFLISFSSFSE
jgi:hypothetical protein